MSGVSAPSRSAPTISTANPPVLIDFVSHVPAPVTRLLVEQAGSIKALRRAAEIASWKSPKASESWILLAAWWLVCAMFVISPALWRYLVAQPWWPWREANGSHEPVAASDATVAATISDITALRLLLPPFLFTSTPVPSQSPILQALRTSRNTLPLKSLLRATAILYIPYLLATWLVPLPIIFGLVGTVVLTIRAPWVCIVRSHVSKSGWAWWIWRRVWAFLTGQQVVVPGSTFTLQEKSPVAVKKSVAQELKPTRLRFRFDILENQRWWVGIDWSSALLPNERQSWCSPAPHLAPLSPPITFALPPPTSHIDKTLKIRRKAFWRWDDPEWTVLVKTSHEEHHWRVHLPLPDASSDSEGRLAKGLKRVGESLPESVNGSAVTGRRSSESGDDEPHDGPLSPSALLKDPLTDPDGWIYADNKWEAPSPKGGLGKYTRYRVWSRCAILVEEVEDLDDAELAATVTSPSGTEKPKNTFEPSTTLTSGVQPHHKSHRYSASEDGIGSSSGVSDRDSKLKSRLKSVLESRGSGSKG